MEKQPDTLLTRYQQPYQGVRKGLSFPVQELQDILGTSRKEEFT